MRGVEVVLNLKVMRRHLRRLIVLGLMALAVALALRVPAVRARAERVADRLAAMFVPTPPAMTVTALALAPTPTATPTATPTPRPTPTPKPTPRPTATPRPTPTAPPTPTPWPAGEEEVAIALKGNTLEVVAVVPPVVYTWFEYDREMGRWVRREARVADPVLLESIQLDAQASNAPDVVVSLCWPDNCRAEWSMTQDSTYILRLVVELGANPPLLDPRVRWYVRFAARTEGTAWGDGHTDPRGLEGQMLIRVQPER